MLRAGVGNGVAKELTCVTLGREQKRGDHWRDWGFLGRREQRVKN